MNQFVFLVFPQMLSRKYDVESEALRLYGEDLNAVLRKFRRTPEYLHLLEEKFSDVRMLFEEVKMSSLQFNIDNKLTQKIAHIFGNHEQVETSPIVRYYKSFNARRDDESGDKNSSSTINPIELLDQYAPFRSSLSTAERNKIKDIAFEIAGQTIHMIIRGMGPLDPQSTRQPFGGNQDEIRITTDRDHRHIVSTKAPYVPILDQSTRNPPVPTSSIDETLRVFKSKNILK